jgi:hypothetical protein
LQLPNEMLIEILSYVPNQLIVGQTCTRFYDVSCEVKTFTLNILLDTTGNFQGKFHAELLQDEVIFNSMMNSKRRIRVFKMKHFMCDWMAYNFERLPQVIEYFGNNVQELELENILVPMSELSALSFMPHIEKISLKLVSATLENFNVDFRKLEELEIIDCDQEVIEIFNHLPDDVLYKLTLKKISNDGHTKTKYFENQRCIKELQTDFDSINFINIQQMKLKRLQLGDYGRYHGKFEDIIKEQEELTYFQFVFRSKELKLVCAELKSLEEIDIKISNNVLSKDLQEISKLRKLKKATLFFDDELCNESISLIRNESLQEMEIHFTNYEIKLLQATVIQLSKNCLSLKILKVIYNYSSRVPCVRFIPEREREYSSIESVTYFGTNIQNALKHQELKKLRIRIKHYEDSHEMLKLLSRCKESEKHLTSNKFICKSLQHLFHPDQSQPEFIYLINSLSNDAALVSVFRTSWKNLKSFECYHLKADEKITEITIGKELNVVI